MNVLRTPDSRFVGLPDYAFAPHYHQVTPQLRLHYVDEGPRDAPEPGGVSDRGEHDRRGKGEEVGGGEATGR